MIQWYAAPECLTDAELVAEWQQTDVDSDRSRELLVEIVRRDLDL